MRAALVQLCVGDNPAENLPMTCAAVDAAAAGGATLVVTPEVTNIISQSRRHQRDVLRPETEDPTLAALRARAASHGIWLVIGSLALKTDAPDGRFANRSFVIAPDGRIAARYDKIHMFDVQVSANETYRESDGFRPGTRAVTAPMDTTCLGLSICYDLRFPHLYRALAKAGAEILTVPAAFSPATGPAHWKPLLMARAIETGCFVLAPAQVGDHPVTHGKSRRTYGHSLAISPWGEVLAEAGPEPGVTFVDLDLSEVAQTRARLPSLALDRPFDAP